MKTGMTSVREIERKFRGRIKIPEAIYNRGWYESENSRKLKGRVKIARAIYSRGWLVIGNLW